MKFYLQFQTSEMVCEVGYTAIYWDLVKKNVHPYGKTMDGLSNRDINVSIVFHVMSYMLYPLYGIIVYDADPMIPPMNIYIYTYIHIPYSNDIPHYSYIIHPYLFHPVISVIIVYSQHSHTPSTQKWRLPTSWTVRWTPRAAMAAAMALCTARWPTACDPTRGIGRNGEEFHPGKHPFCIH